MKQRKPHFLLFIFPKLMKRSSYYLLCIIGLFLLIGLLTTISPTYRFSSQTISDWTKKIESSTFIYMFGMENKAFQQMYPEEQKIPSLSSAVLHLATSIKPNDPRSLLGNELPGFAIFDNNILIAGEGTDYTNLPIESSPPLEEVLKDRDAVVDEKTKEADKENESEKKGTLTTGDKKVVFIYNTHNTESFLPNLPGETDPDKAYDKKVNVTKVSDRFSKTLQEQGIGSEVNKKDIMEILNQRGWQYPNSYQASRQVVQEAFANNKDIKYVFDIHRDASGREHTTTEIGGKSYARIAIVVGEDYASYEKNLAFATKFHYMLEKAYPGLSRGVITKKGKSTNGVFNQDLSENAILLEIGGVGNNLEELYRSADALANVFGDYYWDAEKVNN
ncbi:stage II sporulation protein P [Virgibacillus sp. 179-BFC.A HS]|uniref:Stage II sporulation protein P n=1 Tax=Tigheibacillus jepli TaxID=3035914 RepID=A0ABU5CGS5_9BACI|nr:stage II sporulation protein P [Virgibacillus sp. 179-BFC.A HS]MDY0405519.1 stage II sporulation protein P [Virgibacillus sp. 179-BFC.A HS]